MDPDFRVSLVDRIRHAGLIEIGASAVLHCGLLLFFALAMARLDEDDRELIAREQTSALRGYLAAADGRGGAEAITDGKPGLGDPRLETGREQASGGATEVALTGKHATGTDAHVAARGSVPLDDIPIGGRALQEAQDLYTIGLVRAAAARSAAPAFAWGSALDAADLTPFGAAWGSSIDDAMGGGVLGLSGGGEGGGGRGEGISIGLIGSIGRTGGIGQGLGAGFGHCGDACLGQRTHQTRAPSIRCGEIVDEGGGHRPTCAQVNGRLPPEAIQRVVRQNFGRFRACYDSVVAKNPALEGRVATKFVIDRSGAVAIASEAEGTDLPDATMRNCVVRAFYSLAFPAPEGGIVTVIYPLVFSPGS